MDRFQVSKQASYAALLAASVLALSDAKIARALDEYRARQSAASESSKEAR